MKQKLSIGRAVLFTSVLAVPLSMGMACGGSGTALPPASCVAGQQISCGCPGGGSGVQVCSSDGSQYGPCDCEDGNVGDATSTDVATEPPGDGSQGESDSTADVGAVETGPESGLDSTVVVGDGALDGSADTSPDGTAEGGTDAGAEDAAVDAAPAVVCGDGGAMAPGLTTLAPGTRPLMCVIDACNVYWTDQATGGVMVVPKSGGTPAPFATSSPPAGQSVMSEGIAIDSTYVYWSEYVDTGPGSVPLRTGDVMRTSLSGDASVKIWSGTDAPNAVAVDSTYVYVLQNSDLERVPIDGGQVAVLASGQGAYGLTVTPLAAFWTTYNSIDEIMAVPLDGGTASIFATGTSGAGSSSTMVVQDGTNVYWGDTIPGELDGSVYVKPLDGGAQTVLSSQAVALGIAQDAEYLYVTTGAGGTVLKIAKAGGSVQVLAQGQGWPVGIAVDDAFVYWVNNNGGANSVMRIAK